jgi:DnaJ-class molecular chaperone
MPYDTLHDRGDENDAKPAPPKVCLMCRGQGYLFSMSGQLVTIYNGQFETGTINVCPTCKGTGQVQA